MKTRPHPGAGIEVWDVDLRSVDQRTFARIQQLFVEYGLVFFRDQTLSEEDHIALAQRFGTININRFFPENAAYPEIAMVTKQPGQRANVGGGWHTDHSYDVEPALGSILVARELPNSGGDTWFINAADAFARLPEPMKAKLRTMRAVHSSKHIFGSRGAWLRRLIGSEENSHSPELADALDDVVHPVVIEHPLSGREVLYVNPAFTIGFEGRSLLRSLPLLLTLYALATYPSRVAKFKWRPGSVAIWDNRTTWHYAQNDYDGQTRVMHRITIDGCPIHASSSRQTSASCYGPSNR